MAVVVSARWVAREGAEERIEALLRAVVAAAPAEPGCLAYIGHRDPGDARIFLLYEQYRDRAAYDAHMAAPYVQAAIDEGVPLLSESDVRLYETWEP